MRRQRQTGQNDRGRSLPLRPLTFGRLPHGRLRLAVEYGPEVLKPDALLVVGVHLVRVDPQIDADDFRRDRLARIRESRPRRVCDLPVLARGIDRRRGVCVERRRGRFQRGYSGAEQADSGRRCAGGQREMKVAEAAGWGPEDSFSLGEQKLRAGLDLGVGEELTEPARAVPVVDDQNLVAPAVAGAGVDVVTEVAEGASGGNAIW